MFKQKRKTVRTKTIFKIAPSWHFMILPQNIKLSDLHTFKHNGVILHKKTAL